MRNIDDNERYIDEAIRDLEHSIELEEEAKAHEEERAAAWENYRRTGIRPPSDASDEKYGFEVSAETNLSCYLELSGIDESGIKRPGGRGKSRYTRYALNCLRRFKASGDVNEVKAAYWYVKHSDDLDDEIWI